MFVPTLLRAFFVLASATASPALGLPDLRRGVANSVNLQILFIQSIPPFRSRFLVYGKAATPTTTARNAKDAKPTTSPQDSRNPITALLDHLATYTVPHSFFTHFYILALTTLLLLGQQISTHGPLYTLLRDLPTPEWAAAPGSPRRVVGGQSIHQVVLTWTCLVLQTGRRLYECLFVQRRSAVEGGGGSRMWVVHYALGLAFYLGVGVGGWVEGTDAIDAFKFTPMSLYSLIGPPSARSFIGVLFFILGSGFQHDCHAYLASLEKYTLPVHPAFRKLVCPHYFAECLVYLGLTIMSAPRVGGPFNVTMLTALIFVGVNLGAASMLNREWYIGKFGEKSMEGLQMEHDTPTILTRLYWDRGFRLPII
ncbi:unnamed protein product [Tuber aestivum]|uniref:Polyprenal reductase n=1 Tax=Tuber aestivum TaxID=59557 RepID=A0A292Q176_9PEZI|nr:unnamed protein product [Tuber aestivum]